MKLAYFVHNLADPAIARRIRMLQIGGCGEIVLFGFRRGDKPVAEVAGVPAIDLGQTVDGGFAHRIRSIVSAALALGDHRAALATCDVFLGRNLEGLMLAAIARRRFAPRGRLGYECLDIHRLMLSSRAAPAMRRIEAALLRRTDLVIVSSAAFERDYFRGHHTALPKFLRVENKVLDDGEAPADVAPVPRIPGPPWTLSWVGSLRDHESLILLSRLAKRLDGLVEVSIWGVPSALEMPDFSAVVEATPHMTFHGRYDRARDLPRIYREAHFTWAIERFEKGGNGEWQLVNRLYEGGLFGSVMIAEAAVEMGRWLAERGTGVTLGEPLEDEAARFFQGLDAAAYAHLEAAAFAVPRADHVADKAECEGVVRALRG